MLTSRRPALLPCLFALLAACGPSPRRGGGEPPGEVLPDPAECGIEVASDGILDLDVPVVRISGQITLDGLPLPGASYAPVLTLQLPDSAEGGTFLDLAAVRAAGGTYEVDVVPGEYRLLYSNYYCTDPEYPCQQQAPLEERVSLTSDGVFDIDLRTVQVTGVVTLNGAPLPTAAYPRGQLLLRVPDQGGTGTFLDLDLAVDGAYQTRVLPGAYDLTYYQVQPTCTGRPFPCQQQVVVHEQAVFTSDGAFDLDLATVRLTGRITRNGQAMPPASYSRGRFQLQGADGSTGTLADLDQGGDTYDVDVFPGTYNIVYTQWDAACTGAGVPCQQRVLEGCVGSGIEP